MKIIQLSRQTVELLKSGRLSTDVLPKSIGGEAVEYVGPVETMPEMVALQKILADNRRRWSGNYGPSSAQANKMSHDGLAALNRLNRKFWEGGTR